eukprot:scaffold71_cov247-Pinguiococcus_pyrenoidosus.AAC.13
MHPRLNMSTACVCRFLRPPAAIALSKASSASQIWEPALVPGRLMPGRLMPGRLMPGRDLWGLPTDAAHDAVADAAATPAGGRLHAQSPLRADLRGVDGDVAKAGFAREEQLPEAHVADEEREVIEAASPANGDVLERVFPLRELLRRHQDVLRLQVTVDDAQVVQVADPLVDLLQGAHDALRGPGAPRRLVVPRPRCLRILQGLDSIVQRQAAKLQGEVDEVAGLLLDVVLDDVLMPVALDQQGDLPIDARVLTVERPEHALHGNGPAIERSLEDDGPVGAQPQDGSRLHGQRAHDEPPLLVVPIRLGQPHLLFHLLALLCQGPVLLLVRACQDVLLSSSGPPLQEEVPRRGEKEREEDGELVGVARLLRRREDRRWRCRTERKLIARLHGFDLEGVRQRAERRLLHAVKAHETLWPAQLARAARLGGGDGGREGQGLGSQRRPRSQSLLDG